MPKTMGQVIEETALLFKSHVESHRGDYYVEGAHLPEGTVGVFFRQMRYGHDKMGGIPEMKKYAQDVVDADAVSPKEKIARKLMIELWQRLQTAVKSEGIGELPDLNITHSAAAETHAKRLLEQKIADARRILEGPSPE